MTEALVAQTPAPLPEPQEPVPPETPAPPAELTIAEHAKQFGPDAQKEDGPDGETPEEKTQREHHSAQQKRDKPTGQFEQGKVRHRAQSQQAGAKDVPRIQALTGRAKTAEERLAAAEAEIARLKSSPQASPLAPPVPRNGDVRRQAPEPPADPEPTEADAKYGGDYGKYLVDHARWAARDEHRKWEVQHEEKLATQAAQQSIAQRVTAARAKYQDFDAVADRVMSRIPLKSTVESWIFAHDHGDDVLVYFDTAPQELDAILRLPRPIQQLDALTLLAQRFASPAPAQAGLTGSAAGASTVVLPPRPPNPVRTEASQRASEGPPTDRPLTIAEHAKYFGQKARR